MGKSTRSVQRGRRGDVLTVFNPRTSGPWHALEPLHHRGGFLALLIVTGLGAGSFLSQHNPAAACAVIAVALVLLLASFAATWLVAGMLIRSRTELLVLVVLVGAYVGLRLTLPALWANLLVLGVLAAVLLVPHTSRLVRARFWCVLDRHRLRACLRQAKVRTMNMDGALPFVLWARPTKTGERLWLWVRAGSSAGDIENALDYVAPACYAREARLAKHHKMATLVTLDVIRRHPLAAQHGITNPLAALASMVTGKTAGEGTEPITAATITDITDHTTTAATASDSEASIVDAPGTAQPRPAKKPNKPPQQSSATQAPSVVVNGEDLSDYVD